MLFILLIYFYVYGKVLLHNTCCPSYRDYTIMYWMGCCTNENWIATVIKTIPCACTANSLKPVVVPYTSFQGSCQSPRALCQLLNTEHCDYFHSDTELRERWAMGCSWASHKGGGGEYEWCVIPARMLQSLAECLKVWWRQTWRTTLVKSHPTSVASPFDWQIWVNKFSFNQLFLYAEIYHEVNYSIQWKPRRNQTIESRWLEEKLEDIDTFQPWAGSLQPLEAALKLRFLTWYRFISG